MRLLVIGALLVAAVAPQSISITTQSGESIAGDLYGSGARGVVVIAHGGYSTRPGWASEAQTIADAGFRVLVFETRAAAEFARSGKETPCFYDETCLAGDVLAAVRFLRTRGATTIAVVGGSIGGAAAAQAAVDAASGDIDRIVLLAPAEIASPERMKGRKLFLTARGDANSAGLRLPAIRVQFDRAPEPKTWVVLDGSAHGQRVFQTEQRDAVLRMIVGFLNTP